MPKILMDNSFVSLSAKLSQAITYSEKCHLLGKFLKLGTKDLSGIRKTCHPLGFLVLHLDESQQDLKTRLHIWPSGIRSTQSPNWPVHNHVWDLSSMVLCGEITNNIIDVLPCDTSIYQKYRVSYADDKSLLIATSELVALKLQSSRTYRKGDSYTLDVGCFHESVVKVSQFAATLVLSKYPRSSKFKVLNPEVIGETLGEDSYTYRRTIVEEKTVMILIEKLVDMIESEG